MRGMKSSCLRRESIVDDSFGDAKGKNSGTNHAQRRKFNNVMLDKDWPGNVRGGFGHSNARLRPLRFWGHGSDHHEPNDGG
jgi:hypothetical protein